MLTLACSYSVWTRTAEQTSPSFDEPHFLPTCEYPFFTSLAVANRGRVSFSDWQKLIFGGSNGKTDFATWRPAEVRGSEERSIQHHDHAYPIGLSVENSHSTLWTRILIQNSLG